KARELRAQPLFWLRRRRVGGPGSKTEAIESDCGVEHGHVVRHSLSISAEPTVKSPLSLGKVILRQCFGDQLAAVANAVQRDEAAHPRALAGAEQGFVKRLEPAAQRFER